MACLRKCLCLFLEFFLLDVTKTSNAEGLDLDLSRKKRSPEIILGGWVDGRVGGWVGGGGGGGWWGGILRGYSGQTLWPGRQW